MCTTANKFSKFWSGDCTKSHVDDEANVIEIIPDVDGNFLKL